MTPDEILILLLINTSIATSVLRQLGFVISQAAWGGGGGHLIMWRQARRAELVSAGLLLSLVCSHRLSPGWTLKSLCCSLSCQCNGSHSVGSPALLLTARGTAGEEVSGHLPLPLHLDDTSVVQLVSVVDQHVVQVCGHLREDTDIWHPGGDALNPAQEKLYQPLWDWTIL